MKFEVEVYYSPAFEDLLSLKDSDGLIEFPDDTKSFCEFIEKYSQHTEAFEGRVVFYMNYNPHKMIFINGYD